MSTVCVTRIMPKLGWVTCSTNVYRGSVRTWALIPEAVAAGNG